MHKQSWLSGMASAFLVAAAAASPAALGQTFDVKQPVVTRDSLDFGLDNTAHQGLPRGADLNRSAHDQSLDYGVRDWWRLSAVLKLENPQDADWRVARTALENLVVLRAVDGTRRSDIGWGWFTALETSVHPETTNALIFGPIVSLTADKLSLTANPFLEKTFGRNHAEGIALSYGWQAKYELRHGLAIGLEGYGVIENLANPPPWSAQEHRVGPVIFTEIALTETFRIAPDIGLLFGLTPSTPDVALKLNIGIPLHRH